VPTRQTLLILADLADTGGPKFNITVPRPTPAIMVKRRHYNNWRQSLIGAAATGASNLISSYQRTRGLGRSAGNLTSNKRQRVVTNSVTGQHDFQNLYRRRPAPRRVRRRAKKSMRTFMYNMDKIQGMQVSVINNYTAVTTAPTGSDNAQAVTSFTMYGGYNLTSPVNTHNDLVRIWNNHFGSTPGYAAAYGKLRFRSCVMDFQVLNADNDNACYVEVYNVQNRKKDPNYNTVQRWASSLASNMTPVGGSDLTQNFWKSTPFDAAGFGEFWKITNRKKYLLQGGQQITFQVRDAKNYMIDPKLFAGDITSLPGITEDVLFVVYGAGIQTSGTPAYQSYPTAASVSISCVKTYHYYETQQSNNMASQFAT